MLLIVVGFLARLGFTRRSSPVPAVGFQTAAHHIQPRFLPVLLAREPLHVGRGVWPTGAQRLDMVHLIPRARATPGAVDGAWVLALELGHGRAGAGDAHLLGQRQNGLCLHLPCTLEIRIVFAVLKGIKNNAGDPGQVLWLI